MNYYKLYGQLKHHRIRSLIISKVAQKEGGIAYSETIRKIFKTYHGIEIGYGSYGGCFKISNIPPNVTFGNYCSIANGVLIFRANHPLSFFTTHPLFYNPTMGFVEKDMLNRPPLIIGHDVWIGANVIILPSVSMIGNGAVIGAGSVVTKDVLAYSVIGGNPARLIKMRFDSQTIDDLEESKWWTLKKEELVKIAPSIQKKIIINAK